MEEFISKWSNFWVFQPNKEQLNKAFEAELGELIDEQINLRVEGQHEKIFDIVTDLIRGDLWKIEAVEKIMDVWNDK